MADQAIYIGVKVSRDWLYVWIHGEEVSWQIENDSRGTAVLVTRLVEMAPRVVVLQAADGLEQPVVVELAAAGLTMAVLSPGQAQNFARIIGRFTKNCSVDASMLARIGEALQPAAVTLPDAHMKEFRKLVARRREVFVTLTTERNSLPRATKRARRLLRTNLALLLQQIYQLDRKLEVIVQDSTALLVRDISLRKAAPTFTVRSVRPRVYGTTSRNAQRRKYGKPQ